MERHYQNATEIIQRVHELRTDNAALSFRKKFKMLKEGDEDVVEIEDVVFDHVINMANVLCTCTRPLKITLYTGSASLGIECGNLNPHVLYHLNKKDNGLAGYVLMLLFQDKVNLNALHAHEQPCVCCDEKQEVVTFASYRYDHHSDEEIAKAFVLAIEHFIMDRTPYNDETWNAEYERNQIVPDTQGI